MEKVTENEIISSITVKSNYSHFYYIDNATEKAHCRICLTMFYYNVQKHGTNSLKRHLASKHPNVYKAKENVKEKDIQNQKSIISFALRPEMNSVKHVKKLSLLTR